MSWIYSIVFAGLLFSSDSPVPTISTFSEDAEKSAAVVTVAAADEIEKFEKSYPITPNGRVSVSNVNGSIVVEAWDRNEVRLEATKIADSKETLGDVEILVDARADSFRVETDYKRWNWSDKRNENKNRKLEVQFRLSVPRTAVLDEVETVNGSVTVSNFANTTKISAVNGDVTATNLRGAANLETVNGTVIADFDRLEKGTRIQLETVNGRVELRIPSDANATIKADSLNGNITNDFGLPVRKGQYVGRDLYGRVGTGETQIRLNSVNGRLGIFRKDDGKSVNPATNLLPEKGKDEDWDTDSDRSRSRQNVNRDIAKAMKDSQKHADKAMKDAAREIERIKPELDKIKIDTDKIVVDAMASPDVQVKINEALIRKQEVLARMDEAVWSAGMPMIEKKTNTFTVKGTPKVNVDAKNCSVNVRGWDKQEVRYVLTEFSGLRDRKPVSVKEAQTSGGVDLKVVSDPGEWNSNGYFDGGNRLRLEIYVPRKSNLKITSDGEIRLEGVSGDIEVIGEDEDINVRDSDGKLNVSNTDGQIRVVAFRGDLVAKTGDGDIYMDGDFTNITGKANDGRFIVTLPEGIDADVSASGNDFSFTIEDLANGKEMSKNNWRFGKGGRKYQFTTIDGSLLVQNRDLIDANE